nr:hypothetical protein [uncultured Kingella sp.]
MVFSGCLNKAGWEAADYTLSFQTAGSLKTVSTPYPASSLIR